MVPRLADGDAARRVYHEKLPYEVGTVVAERVGNGEGAYGDACQGFRTLGVWMRRARLSLF